MNQKIFICLLFLFTIIHHAHSLPKEILVISDANDYSPYEINFGNNKFGGIYIETVLEAAKLLNIKLTFKEFPWARCLVMIKKGHSDAIMTPFKTKERLKYMYFANEPIAYEETSLFTNKSNQINFNGNLNNLKKYNIGVVRGFSYGEKWDKMKFPYVTTVNSQRNLIKMLVVRRVDVLIGTKYIIQYLAKEENASKHLVTLKPSLSRDAGYLAFSKIKGPSHKKLAIAFARAIRRVKKSKKYKMIFKKYGIKEFK